MKKQIINQLKKIFVLSGIFIAALIIYFISAYSHMEKSSMVYAAMDEAHLPVVFVESNGYLLNPMHGHLQEMGNQLAMDMITVLPEDRRLKLVVREYDHMVVSVNYEIRTLSMDRLLENGLGSDINRKNGEIEVQLPIQNLINKEQEYLLKITLDTGEKSINYYTRILWTDKDYTKSMEDLALNFTRNTFDKVQARNLAVYLETDDITDNSSFDHVTLRSSFNQITWGDSGMSTDGIYYMTLKEFSGLMGAIQINYESYQTDSEGLTRNYRNEDNFILRYDPQRVYVMDYDRRTEEIFDGKENRFDGKRIVLGTQSTQNIELKRSKNDQYLVFKTAGSLWRYDESGKGNANCIFSFRSDSDDGLRSGYTQHDIKILSVEENGDVRFLVYGYMNRGIHEGYEGVIYYTFNSGSNTVVENFFIAVPQAFEKIKYNIDSLSYLSQSGMFYIYGGGSVYGIDTNSFEVVTIASELKPGAFAGAENGRFIAFLNSEETMTGQGSAITCINLDDNKSTDITRSGSSLRVFGFVGDDLVYGITPENISTVKTTNGDTPVSEIHVVGTGLDEKTNYKKENQYYSDVEVLGTRIHFTVLQESDGDYTEIGKNTIISNRKKNDVMEGTGSFMNGILEKNLYLEIKDIGTKRIEVSYPRSFSVEKASVIDLNMEDEGRQDLFSGYVYGHFSGYYRTLQDAYRAVYDNFGYIVDENAALIWNRTDRSAMASSKKNRNVYKDLLPLEDFNTTSRCYDDYMVINADGLSMTSVLYYIGKGYPVIAETGSRYRIIFSYDNHNIRWIDPETDEENLQGKKDAEEYFAAKGNRFKVLLPIKK